MHVSDIQLLFDYGYWANARLLRTAEKLTSAQFTEPVFSIGSVHSTLAHQLGADWIWRMRFQEGISPTATVPLAELPTLEAIRSRWQSEETQMRSWLPSLTDDDLPRTFHFKTLNGTPWALPVGPLLLHVHNHGTQHRSEVAAMLTQLDHSPGDLDFLLYLHEKQ
jgi:uncharacterized damage-inducible protein DinB